jgi:hypothetical protein
VLSTKVSSEVSKKDFLKCCHKSYQYFQSQKVGFFIEELGK